MSKRNNELVGRELDIVSRSVSMQVTTFDEALAVFIKDAKRRGLREFTITYYQRELNHFRTFLVSVDHSLFIHDVQRKHLEELVEDMQVRGLRTTTINSKLRAIRAFFHWLLENKYLAVNGLAKFPLVRDRKNNVETFTVKQLHALLNATDKRTFTGQRDYTFMMLLLETGIRLNEACGILVEDVKLSEGLVFIRNTKNHYHRYVPIQAKMKEQLRRYLQIRGTCETDALFVTLEGTAMKRNSLQKIVAQYGNKAGIKGVRCSPHTMRHTFAKLSVMNGAGIFELQKILGHSTMEMVKTYVNLFSTEVHDKHREFSPLNNL